MQLAPYSEAETYWHVICWLYLFSYCLTLVQVQPSCSSRSFRSLFCFMDRRYWLIDWLLSIVDWTTSRCWWRIFTTAEVTSWIALRTRARHEELTVRWNWRCWRPANRNYSTISTISSAHARLRNTIVSDQNIYMYIYIYWVVISACQIARTRHKAQRFSRLIYNNDIWQIQ